MGAEHAAPSPGEAGFARLTRASAGAQEHGEETTPTNGAENHAGYSERREQRRESSAQKHFRQHLRPIPSDTTIAIVSDPRYARYEWVRGRLDCYGRASAQS
jgi:hypothetical protein